MKHKHRWEKFYLQDRNSTRGDRLMLRCCRDCMAVERSPLGHNSSSWEGARGQWIPVFELEKRAWLEIVGWGGPRPSDWKHGVDSRPVFPGEAAELAGLR
jgi:hypothetical protein